MVIGGRRLTGLGLIERYCLRSGISAVHTEIHFAGRELEIEIDDADRDARARVAERGNRRPRELRQARPCGCTRRCDKRRRRAREGRP